MTIETYYLVLNGIGLAAGIAGLIQPKERWRVLLGVIVVTSLLAVLGGYFILRTTRERQIAHASEQLAEHLGPWGRPFEDLRRQMTAFPADIVEEALQRAENSGEVKRVPRTVHDPKNARDYNIDIFMEKRVESGRLGDLRIVGQPLAMGP